MPLATQTIDAMRTAAEKSLYYFARAILGLQWLTPQLHREMCEFMQSPDKPRKLELVPRDHAKTVLVKAQIQHVMIQPAGANIYFPGVAGTDIRMIVAGETTKNAARHLRNIETNLEKNKLFRTLWPHIKPGSKWSEHELELVRGTNYSEPTVEALGTDTAIASRHVDWIFCDDIYTFEAMQSSSVSERVSLWFDALEPVLDETENTQAKLTVTGTAWAERDVYKKIIDSIAAGEEEYDVFIRAVIENGQPIWPERFPLTRLKRIERRASERGLWFYNWMNAYGESDNSDFRKSWLKEFTLEGTTIVRSDGSVVALRDCDIVTTYDPARTRQSEYKHLARNAIMTTACDAQYNVYVLAYYADRDSLKNIYDALKLQSDTFHPRCIGIEDVATQVAIGDAFDLIAQLQGDSLAPIVSLRPDTATNKKWRIKTSLQRVAPYGRLYIQPDMFEFKVEWSAFPNGRTIDILDVAAYCVGLHNIPDDSATVDYNKKIRDRMSNVIDLEVERDARYEVRRPPEDVRSVMRIG